MPDIITVTGKGSIQYSYDASGNKLQKIVTDNTATPAKVTSTTYIGGFVYQNDTLQFLPHEEGRIRTVFRTGDPVAYVYDYFLKDHLGNVRTVLTEQTDFTMYAATMEREAAAQEVALFSNVEETRAETPSGYPVDQTTAANKFVAKLNAKAGGKKIGPSLVLRVMAGDTVQINAKAFYKSQGPADNGHTAPVEDVVTGLVQAFDGNASENGTHGATAMANKTPFNADFYNNNYQRLKEKNKDNGTSDRPKAYLNFVLFNDDFKLVEENSGVRQVKGSPDELQELGVEKMAVAKSGYLYVYTSNESQQDVFFDNVVLGLASGPLLEETHYYPYGLTMAGISSNALMGGSYAKNRKEYNGIEHTIDLELNQYDAFYRNFDAQIGRWWQIDPKPNVSVSLYAMMENNPISNSDVLGDTILPNVSYDYSKTANPIKKSDLGNTSDTNIGIATSTSTGSTITIDIAISLSAAFKGTTSSANIETQNPGLEREVKAHEEGHKDQLMDAANAPVSLYVGIDGEIVSFSGRADKVIDNASSAFINSTQASYLTNAEKTTFINDNISIPATSAMIKNIDAVYTNPNRETNANDRAAANLGASTILYNNGSKPILFNGIKLK
jgi:RHS repeat-associated protein